MRAVETTNGRFSALSAQNCCPECTAASAGQALGSLGRLFCSEIDVVVDALQASLREAWRVRGVEPTKQHPAAQAAVEFINRYKSGFLVAPIFGTETCKNLIQRGNSLTEAMNSFIGSSGVQTPIPQSEIKTEGGWSDTLGSIKTIAIAGAVIAGVVLLAPVVLEVVGARRAARGGR